MGKFTIGATCGIAGMIIGGVIYVGGIVSGMVLYDWAIAHPKRGTSETNNEKEAEANG